MRHPPWLLAIGIYVVLATTTATTTPTAMPGPGGTGSYTTAAAQTAGGARLGLSEHPNRHRPQYAGRRAVVLAISHVGDRVVVGGKSIKRIIQGNGRRTRGANLSATAPGNPSRVTWRAPVRKPSWWDVIPAGDGRDIIAAGRGGVWRFDLRSHRVVWHHGMRGVVTTVQRIKGTRVLLVGGDFKRALTALNLATGRTARYDLPAVTGRLDVPNAGPTQVYRGAVSPRGRRYVFIGHFTKVGAHAHEQAAVLALGRNGARVTRWRPPMLRRDPNDDGYTCGRRWPAFLRDVAWAPNGSGFVMVSGGGPRRGACDAASRWRADRKRPVWVSPTCNDSLTSVEFTANGRVLVGGHMKCIGANRGHQRPRFGIALLNGDGTVNPWKSDKCRGIGGRVISRLPRGYGVGYDCGFWGNNEHANPDPSPQFSLQRFAFLRFKR